MQTNVFPSIQMTSFFISLLSVMVQDDKSNPVRSRRMASDTLSVQSASICHDA